MRTQSANYARMVEHVSPYNRVIDTPASMGAWNIETASGLAKLSNEIARQSIMIGYMNAWLLYIIAAVLVIPLALLSKAPKRRLPVALTGPHPHHYFFGPSATALRRSSSSSQPDGHSFSRMARCSLAFGMLLVITYSSPRYSCAPLWLGSKSSALP